MKNHGLIQEMIPNAIGYVGGVGGSLPILNPSGDWEPFLPDYEAQSKLGLETMNCVQFSRLNDCEIQAKFHGKRLNLSDRFLYWATGCTEKGNSFSACDYGFKLRGCCGEMLWPWIVPLTRAQYGKEPPEDVKQEALRLLERWTIGMLRYVPLDVESMKDALMRGPLWVCNDIHAFEIYRIDTHVHVFDTYAGGKRMYNLNFIDQLVAAYNAPFTPKQEPMPKLNAPDNSLVAIVDGPGHRLMYANGKLYKDDAGKIELELQARNSVECPATSCVHCPAGEYVPHRRYDPVPVVHLKMKDIEGIPMVNLKDEPV